MTTPDTLSEIHKSELVSLLMDASRQTSSLRGQCDSYKAERDDYKLKLDHALAERDRLRANASKIRNGSKYNCGP